MRPRSNWTPVVVSNRADRKPGAKDSLGDVAAPGPDFTALHVTYLNNGDELSAGGSNAVDRTIQRQADLRFAIGVAIALALPVLIGIGVYIAMTGALRTS